MHEIRIKWGGQEEDVCTISVWDKNKMRMTNGWRLNEIRIKQGWHMDDVCMICAWDNNRMRMTRNDDR